MSKCYNHGAYKIVIFRSTSLRLGLFNRKLYVVLKNFLNLEIRLQTSLKAPIPCFFRHPVDILYQRTFENITFLYPNIYLPWLYYSYLSYVLCLINPFIKNNLIYISHQAYFLCIIIFFRLWFIKERKWKFSQNQRMSRNLYNVSQTY